MDINRKLGKLLLLYLKKLHGLSPWANYTNRATAAFGEVIANFCG
jgi:hypothetical protein